MSDSLSNTSEAQLREIAAHFVYPPTPDIAARERRRLSVDRPVAIGPAATSPVAQRPVRLLAGVAAMIVLLLAIALLVPQTRAALLEFFDIGAIRLLVDEEAAEPLPEGVLLDLAGATTLADASSVAAFDVLLPAYPADLGLPDQVYVQQLEAAGNDEQVVILTWSDPAQPDGVRLSLYQIALPFYGIKQATLDIIHETRVNGQPAFWVEGPHRLQLQAGDFQDWLFVPGNVLIWTEGRMTYRLESGLSLDEAIRIAESMRQQD